MQLELLQKGKRPRRYCQAHGLHSGEVCRKCENVLGRKLAEQNRIIIAAIRESKRLAKDRLDFGALIAEAQQMSLERAERRRAAKQAV